MKILFVNKFLFRSGGAETYMFKLGDYLQSEGHTVEYFGMDHPERIVGNSWDLYTEQMDFHSEGIFNKIKYPFRVIRSKESYDKMWQLLLHMDPDVVHINTFNYQITPSIIEAIRDYKKKYHKKITTIYTAHDYQLVCPNHMQYIPQLEKICDACSSKGCYYKCFVNKCIHESRMRSIFGMLEAYYWKFKKIYSVVDTIICPSMFMKKQIDKDNRYRHKSVFMLNFIDSQPVPAYEKKDYVLYFGRLSKEKGIGTLLKVCKSLPQIHFIYAGNGPLEDELKNIPNVEYVGHKSGEELSKLIGQARFSVYPSEWNENCPFSVMESLMCGTPVIGSDKGGIPELINNKINGLVFEAANEGELKKSINTLWNDTAMNDRLIAGCRDIKFNNIEEYAKELLDLYKGI